MIQTSIFDYLYPPYKTTKPIRLIELFAGVGSQAMALRDLGANFEHHRVIEIDPFAIKSYNVIHGTNFKPIDITWIHGDDLGIFDKKRYEYIMTYSFPCQDLSKAGKQAGMSKDSGTRSGLLWEVERILKELNETDSLPQVLLMENVPDVIGTKNIKDFNEWYAFLESIGYQSYCKLLNAKNYGVPQNRNRCFMVSVLGDYSYTFPRPIPLEKRLKDVLDAEVDERHYISNEKTSEFYEKASRDISNCIRTSGRGSLDRHSWDVIQIGNCMPTQTRDNPNQGRIYAVEGLAPTVMTMQSGNSQPMIIQNGHGFNKGGLKEICPTITTGAFRENNFVAEPVCLNSKVNGKQPSLQDRIYDADAISTAITTSFMPNIAEPVICASRGRNPDNPKSRQSGLPTVQMMEVNESGCSNTLTTVQKDNMVLSNQSIRKLTPLECWRLMGFSDEDFRKAEAVNSNTQLYSQAGNSIVKQVLMAIFKEMM